MEEPGVATPGAIMRRGRSARVSVGGATMGLAETRLYGRHATGLIRRRLVTKGEVIDLRASCSYS